MKERSWALFSTVVLIWGSCWTLIKVGLLFVNPLNLVTQRLLLASIGLSPFLILRRRNIPKDWRTWIKISVLGLVNAASMILTNIGLLYEPIGLSALLTYTQPFFVFCLAAVFLNEKIGVIKILGVIAGFSGVTVLYAGRSSSQKFFINSFLSLIFGVFLWAVTVVYYKKLLSHLDPFVINAVQFLVGSVSLLPSLSVLRVISFNYNPLYIFSILYIALLGSALASTIWLLLIREEETTVVSASSLIIPVVATLLGWVFMGEPIGYSFLLSLVLVLTGLSLVNLGHNVRRRPGSAQ